MRGARHLPLVLAVMLAACRQGGEPAATPSEHAGHGAPHGTMAASEAEPSGETVTVDARGAALANVATARVTRRRLRPQVVAAGRITLDESRMFRCTTWVAGRIQRLRVATTGASVRQGQALAEVYSPELVATQQELLVAKASARALAGSPIEGVAADASRLVEAGRRRLRLSGLTAAQVAEVERIGRPIEAMPILAPASGVITRRLVQAGDWVPRGGALFEIADMSRVWAEVDVYESELASLRVGLPVDLEATAYPGRTYRGKLAFVQPTLAAGTRTNTVRIELPNPDGRLKPDMLVTASIQLPAVVAVVVPADAVVDSGQRQVVWVQQGPGRFVARPVVLGARSDGGYAITRGLVEGETIAVSGGFLLDASSQLERLGGPHAGHGAATAPPEGDAPHRGHGPSSAPQGEPGHPPGGHGM
jgi:Cu(I)/Ag(I) efflux system membrane fusion protein